MRNLCLQNGCASPSKPKIRNMIPIFSQPTSHPRFSITNARLFGTLLMDISICIQILKRSDTSFDNAQYLLLHSTDSLTHKWRSESLKHQNNSGWEALKKGRHPVFPLSLPFFPSWDLDAKKVACHDETMSPLSLSLSLS